ncbi:MAG TPA: flagellar biosynthetic protein FliO, partial [Opitutaceae bacterium]|nr:flagellar biosynthetic protein FliO [Opitutaceae bacterium]
RRAASAGEPARGSAPGGTSALLLVAAAAAGVGAWYLLRRRNQAVPGAERKLVIAETRSLGNRQYLVVADYEGRKLLLGVCPGRIDLLTKLEDEE